MTVAILGALTLILQLFWVWRLARLDEPSRARWLLRAADLAAFLAFLILITRWDILGLHTRTAILTLLAVAAAWSLLRHRRRPWRSAAPWPRAERRTAVASLAFVLGLAGYAASGLLPQAGAHPLACPLAGGRFIVGQGGGNRLVNHHAGHPAQTHAADILALGRWGFRADGPQPHALDRYAIHGAAVVSPCDGRVLAARDGLPDLAPPQSDPENPAGNHVILVCGSLAVELAHLENASLAVSPGDTITTGERIGRVGNSGNTTEPHLHIHAVDAATGRAAPVTLGGATPARNRVLDC